MWSVVAVFVEKVDYSRIAFALFDGAEKKSALARGWRNIALSEFWREEFPLMVAWAFGR
jgi:hypothetical protein